MREVLIGPGYESWQAAARALLRDDVPPADVTFREAGVDAPVIEVGDW